MVFIQSVVGATHTLARVRKYDFAALFRSFPFRNGKFVFLLCMCSRIYFTWARSHVLELSSDQRAVWISRVCVCVRAHNRNIHFNLTVRIDAVKSNKNEMKNNMQRNGVRIVNAVCARCTSKSITASLFVWPIASLLFVILSSVVVVVVVVVEE